MQFIGNTPGSSNPRQSLSSALGRYTQKAMICGDISPGSDPGGKNNTQNRIARFSTCQNLEKKVNYSLKNLVLLLLVGNSHSTCDWRREGLANMTATFKTVDNNSNRR